VGCETPGGSQPGPEEAEAPGGEDPPAAQQVAYHMVNRRYSEFLNLQTRLEEKADLRRLIKGQKGRSLLWTRVRRSGLIGVS